VIAALQRLRLSPRSSGMGTLWASEKHLGLVESPLVTTSFSYFTHTHIQKESHFKLLFYALLVLEDKGSRTIGPGSI
jgi:hypothetical protein